MTEFWVSSGHHLTHRADGGGLKVTDELILAYLARPELAPPAEACAAEMALHASLLREPRRAVASDEVARLADADARENWQVMLAFRERLLEARTVEAAYLKLVREGGAELPSLFLNQLVHLILRNALDGCDDPYVLRAAELFFRPQKASFHDGALLLADADTVEGHEQGAGRSPLAIMLAPEPASELDIMDDGNAWSYWSRSDAFSMALNMGTSPKSREGFARVVEAFVRHLLAVEVTVVPIARIEDADWRWFIGLDAAATGIGNAIWQGDDVSEEALSRIVAMFRLDFADGAAVLPRVAGHPVYLLLATGPDKMVRMKPQNLVMGLPLAEGASGRGDH